MNAADLEAALRRWREGGIYRAPEPQPGDAPDKHRAAVAGLAAAMNEPPDPGHAAEAALHLIDSFPGCRVGKVAYAEGLSDIVADDDIPPCVVRFACRRARAEAKTLPPLAELRALMLAEMRARRGLLTGLELFPDRLAEAQKRDIREAQRIAASAARHGATLDPGDIAAVWQAAAEGWLAGRATMRDAGEGGCVDEASALMLVLDHGRPRDVFEAIAHALPDLAAYCRNFEAAIAAARDTPAGSPEDRAWLARWPMPQDHPAFAKLFQAAEQAIRARVAAP